MNAKQLARIKKMEDDYNLVREVVHSMPRLSEYRESGQWLKDFEADERGIIAKGVLGLDGTVCKSDNMN